jgi:hypothetical protein
MSRSSADVTPGVVSAQRASHPGKASTANRRGNPPGGRSIVVETHIRVACIRGVCGGFCPEGRVLAVNFSGQTLAFSRALAAA